MERIRGDIKDYTQETNENFTVTAHTRQLRNEMHHRTLTSPPTDVLILSSLPFDTQAKAMYQKIDKVVYTVMFKDAECPPGYNGGRNRKKITSTTFKGMKGIIHYMRLARNRRGIEYLHLFRTAIFLRWLLYDENVVDLNKVIEQEPESHSSLYQYRFDYRFWYWPGLVWNTEEPWIRMLKGLLSAMTRLDCIGGRVIKYEWGYRRLYQYNESF